VRRGEVWWANLPSPAGHRPVVLISRNEAYSFGGLVTIAPVSRRIRRIPAEVALGPEDGMPTACAVNLDSLTTIPRAELLRQIASLSEDKLRAVDTAIHFPSGLKT
jgi:mRNA interferase MazF